MGHVRAVNFCSDAFSGDCTVEQKSGGFQVLSTAPIFRNSVMLGGILIILIKDNSYVVQTTNIALAWRIPHSVSRLPLATRQYAQKQKMDRFPTPGGGDELKIG
jgi:hypothetical protein